MKTATVLLPRSIIILTILILLGLNGLIVRQTWDARDQALLRGEEGQALQHRLLIAFADQTLRGYDYIARDLAERALPANPDAELQRLKVLDPMLMDILVMSPTGVTQYWSGVGKPPGAADRDFFTALRDDPSRSIYVSPARLSRAHKGKWYFSLSRPIRDVSGNFKGVVVVIVDLAVFNGDLAGILAFEGASLGLFKADGQVITRLPETNTNRQLKVQLPPAVLAATEGQLINLEIVSPFDEQVRQTAWKFLPQYGTWIVISITKDQILGLWLSELKSALLIWLIFNALLIAAAVSMVRAAQRNTMQMGILQDMTAKLEIQATVDPLTGLFNRRHFDRVAEVELERSRRQHSDLCLIMVDLDHFKRVNDQWGHPEGDRVLQAIAALLRHSLRDTDVLARFGGEEFVILLSATNLQQAQSFAERLRQGVEDLCAHKELALPYPLTVSIGVTQIKVNETQYTNAFRRADLALYKAKANGRNRVELAVDDPQN